MKQNGMKRFLSAVLVFVVALVMLPAHVSAKLPRGVDPELIGSFSDGTKLYGFSDLGDTAIYATDAAGTKVFERWFMFSQVDMDLLTDISVINDLLIITASGFMGEYKLYYDSKGAAITDPAVIAARAPAPTPTPVPKVAAISIDKAVYAPGETVKATITGVTVEMLNARMYFNVYTQDPTRSWSALENDIMYAQAADGVYEMIAPKAGGAYEVRVFDGYNDGGGLKPMAVAKFTVDGALAPVISAQPLVPFTPILPPAPEAPANLLTAADDWRSLYKTAYANQRKLQFALLDLNGDGIPEIFSHFGPNGMSRPGDPYHVHIGYINKETREVFAVSNRTFTYKNQPSDGKDITILENASGIMYFYETDIMGGVAPRAMGYAGLEEITPAETDKVVNERLTWIDFSQEALATALDAWTPMK